MVLVQVALAAALLAIGALHLAWACGSTWPRADRAALAALVIGRPVLPGPIACAAVALVFFVGTALVGSLGHLSGTLATMAHGATLAMAAVFALRGGWGFLEARVRREIVGTPYAVWNVRLYSPLCVGLAALAVVAGASS
ncbi:MAG: DUF3995 domain-containing protein [Polyangiaceae bacterium]|nr:DUF3995 domain-containing protein [Polyangiaceae bacterium]